MRALARPVPIVSAGAVTAHGRDWRGLSQVLRRVQPEPPESDELERSHPGTRAFEVRELPEPESMLERRARPLMSRSAVLAAMATSAVLRDAGWRGPLEDVGFYLGVGASGGGLEQLNRMLVASVEHGELSPEGFGERGLAACNPLFAFQLMNNFTLCHSAIFHGTQGPNAAFFSRGSGTVVALYEAAHAILDDDCPRALAGGADSCVHGVTWAELQREGWAAQGLIPGEGAALLALTHPEATEPSIAFLDYVSVCACGPLSTPELDCSSIDAVVLAPWGPPARDTLLALAQATLPGRPVLDVSHGLGESLAAAPALAWAVALDLVRSESLARVLILSRGLDDELGVVALRRGVE